METPITTMKLDKIYQERKYELAWEMVSRQDMIRFGKFSAPGYLRPETTPEYRKLFPIPYKAWQSNDKLVQNPGYPAFQHDLFQGLDETLGFLLALFVIYL